MRSRSATRFTALANGVLTALLLATLVLAGPAPTLAQDKDEYDFDDVPAAEPSAVVKAIETELKRTAGEYWTARLNEYKVRIDKLLTPEDLAMLNRLRVRWAILVDYGLRKYHEEKSAQGVKETDARKELGIDDDEAEKMNEMMEIHTAATALAERYRSGLDPIGPTVLGDIVGFLRLLEERLAPMIKESRASSDGSPRSMSSCGDGDVLHAIITELESEKGRKDMLQTYSTAIEPIVVLYNGGDLSVLLGGAPTPVAGTFGDLTSADMSALKQNFPNPASTRTTIAYVLAEPSSSTMLRVYNAGGDLVTELDQGSRPAGENMVDLDVSSYPSGTYLYHLTLQTEKGQRVYAKTMKVVR